MQGSALEQPVRCPAPNQNHSAKIARKTAGAPDGGRSPRVALKNIPRLFTRPAEYFQKTVVVVPDGFFGRPKPVVLNKQIGGRGLTRPVRIIRRNQNENEDEIEGRPHCCGAQRTAREDQPQGRPHCCRVLTATQRVGWRAGATSSPPGSAGTTASRLGTASSESVPKRFHVTKEETK